MSHHEDFLDEVYATPRLRAAFKAMLVDLLKNDPEVYMLVVGRARDVVDATALRNARSPMETP